MAKRKESKSTSRSRPRKNLVLHQIENISKNIFKRYYPQITELIAGSHGIYALYDGSELYYVGKSTDLRKRVRAHLRDQHLASWTHFSLYLVRRVEHINEIESLLIRISNPKGNRAIPKGKADTLLLKKLQTLIKQKQKEELKGFFGREQNRPSKVKPSPGEKAALSRKSLKGFVDKRTPLYKSYKGNEYKAYLLPSGVISLAGKKYHSPTAAAKAVTGYTSINGWKFWYIKNEDGEWVRMADLRS